MTTIQFRQGSPEEWVAKNPVLESAEPGYEIGTRKYKLGDGETPWNDLAYSNAVTEITPEVVEQSLPERLSQESLLDTINGELTSQKISDLLPSRLSQENIVTTVGDEILRDGSPYKQAIIDLVGDQEGPASGEWNSNWDAVVNQLITTAVESSLQPLVEAAVSAALDTALGNVVRSDTVRNIVTSTNPDGVVLQQGDLLASLLPPDGV